MNDISAYSAYTVRQSLFCLCFLWGWGWKVVLNHQSFKNVRQKNYGWRKKTRRKVNYFWSASKEGDEWKTAFNTPAGLYKYLVMPFGLINASAFYLGVSERLSLGHDQLLCLHPPGWHPDLFLVLTGAHPPCPSRPAETPWRLLVREGTDARTPRLFGHLPESPGEHPDLPYKSHRCYQVADTRFSELIFTGAKQSFLVWTVYKTPEYNCPAKRVNSHQAR